MAKKEQDLVELLAESLNKNSKDGPMAYFLDANDSPANIVGWVSTGASTLDIAIANRANGGFPVGRISEITGLEQSGKSLLSAHALASTQLQGGVAVMIDTESAVSTEFLTAIGVDVGKLLYVPVDSVEQVFETMEMIIEKVRLASKDRFVTIVIDSVAAASTKKELEADYAKDGYATDKAIMISKAMRKITNMIAQQKITVIFTNQLRQKMNAMAFADPWTTSGGKALAFHSSVRLRLSVIGDIKDANKQVIGIKVSCKVIKNRLGPPKRVAVFNILFDRGIDDLGSWLDVMKDNSLIKQGGAWYTYVDIETGEELKFQSKEFNAILKARPEIRTQIYERICESQILKYKDKDDDAVGAEIYEAGPEE